MPKTFWIPIYGNATVANGTITHKPSLAIRARSDTPTADASPVYPPHTVLRSNLDFDQGSVTFEAKLLDPESRVQLLLAAEPTAANISSGVGSTEAVNTELAVGLNVLGAPYGFAFWNGAWEGAGGGGHGSSFPLNEWIPLKVTVTGSTVDLYIHGVKVGQTNRTMRRGQIGLMLQSNSECAARNVLIIADTPTCFVIMQFTPEFDALYRDVIKPVCEAHGYKVERGDDFFSPGQVMEDVSRSIRSASLVIADVTPDNANVYYEVGFAHAIRKPTILLSDKRRERLPFDISGFRTLFYDNTIGGKSIVEARLKQHLAALRA